jgi:exosortase
MASATIPESEARAIRPACRDGGLVWAWSLAAIVAAHVPVLCLRSAAQWSDPDHNIFPLVWAGAGFLAWRGTRALGPLEPGRRGLAWTLLLACWLALGAAAVVGSPWLGCAAAQAALMVLAYAWGGRRLALAVLPAWGLLGLMMTPIALTRSIGQSLQQLATRWSSEALDLIGVFHLPQGNVIVLAGRRLLVEEACSGIHSLFAILAVTLFFALWRRISAVHLVVLLAAAAFWVLVVNTGRIVLVAWAAARRGVDLAAGWRHEALGLALVAVTLGLLASTECLYPVVAAGLRGTWTAAVTPLLKWRRRWLRKRAFWRDAGQDRPLASELPAVPVPGPPPVPPPALGPTRWPAPGATALARRAVAAGYAVLAALMLVLFWPAVCEGLKVHTAETAMVKRLGTLAADALPASKGAFRRLDFKVERREAHSVSGEHSRTWFYASGARQAAASVDYPFRDWHDLTVCYTSAGWTVLAHGVEPGEVVAVDLREGTRVFGDYATLFFSLVRPGGSVLSQPLPETPRPWYEPLQKLDPRRSWDVHLRRLAKTYQVQLLVTGSGPLSAEERARARAFFLDVRSLVMRKVDSIGGVSR